MTTKKQQQLRRQPPFAKTRKDGPSAFSLRCDALNGFEQRLIFFGAFDEDVRDSGEEEDGQDDGVERGGVVAFLDEPPVVDDSGDGGDVDEAVETLPVFSAHGTQNEGG